MPKLVANGLNFHYQQAGAGPDVVLIHGVTGDLSIWFLCEAMGILGRSFRVTAFDLRGHGYSDVPPDGYTSADQAGDRLAIMDALEIDRAMLVGHSFGAVIAMHAAVLFPDRIDAVVLSDPCFPALRHLEDVSRWGHWQNFRQEAAEAGVTLSDEHWYDLGRFFDQVLHLDGERLLRFRQAVGLPGFNRLLAAGRHHLRRRRQGPGRADRGADSERDPAGAGHLRRAFAVPGDGRLSGRASAQCVARTVPGAKHRAPEENGAEFVELVNEFLIANSTAGSSGEGDTMSAKPTVLLTGAAHGIGRATAVALARKGMPLGLIDRDAAGAGRARADAQERGRDAVASAAVDVTDRDSLDRGRRPASRPSSGRSTSWSPAPGSARSRSSPSSTRRRCARRST